MAGGPVDPGTRAGAAAFNTLKPSGYTAMFDAVKLIAPAFQRAEHGRKVLLVISDGRDSLVPRLRGKPAPVSRTLFT